MQLRRQDDSLWVSPQQIKQVVIADVILGQCFGRHSFTFSVELHCLWGEFHELLEFFCVVGVLFFVELFEEVPGYLVVAVETGQLDVVVYQYSWSIQRLSTSDQHLDSIILSSSKHDFIQKHHKFVLLFTVSLIYQVFHIIEEEYESPFCVLILHGLQDQLQLEQHFIGVLEVYVLVHIHLVIIVAHGHFVGAGLVLPYGLHRLFE